MKTTDYTNTLQTITGSLSDVLIVGTFPFHLHNNAWIFDFLRQQNSLTNQLRTQFSNEYYKYSVEHFESCFCFATTKQVNYHLV